MNKRLLEIMNYKTGGKQTEFAALLGWAPQYLAKLLKGDNFGLQPVLAVVILSVAARVALKQFVEKAICFESRINDSIFIK